MYYSPFLHKNVCNHHANIMICRAHNICALLAIDQFLVFSPVEDFGLQQAKGQTKLHVFHVSFVAFQLHTIRFAVLAALQVSSCQALSSTRGHGARAFEDADTGIAYVFLPFLRRAGASKPATNAKKT